MKRSRRLLGKALRAATVVTVVAVLINTVIHVRPSGFYATFCSFVLLFGVLAASRPLRADATQQDVDGRMQELLTAERALAKTYDGRLNRPGNASRRGCGLVQLVDDVTRLRIALRWPADKTAQTAQTAQTAAEDIALLHTVHHTLQECGKAVIGEGAVPGLEQIRAARDEHSRGVPQTAERLLAEGKSNEPSERANASFCFHVTALIAEMMVRHTRLALGKYVDDMRGDDGHPGVQTMVAVTIVVLMLCLIGDSKIMLIILLPIVAFFAAGNHTTTSLPPWATPRPRPCTALRSGQPPPE